MIRLYKRKGKTKADESSKAMLFGTTNMNRQILQLMPDHLIGTSRERSRLTKRRRALLNLIVTRKQTRPNGELRKTSKTHPEKTGGWSMSIFGGG